MKDKVPLAECFQCGRVLILFYSVVFFYILKNGCLEKFANFSGIEK